MNKQNIDKLEEMKIKMMKGRIKSKKYPKSVLLVLLSSTDIEILQEDPDFQEFTHKVVTKEKSGRFYKMNPYSNSEVSNLISFFSGSKPEITGVKGNVIVSTDDDLYMDSVFKRFKKTNIKNSIIASPDVTNFFRSYFPDANNKFTNTDSVDLLEEFENNSSNRLMDEKRFQKMLNEVHDLNSQYENMMESDGISADEEDKSIIKDAYHKNNELKRISDSLLSSETYKNYEMNIIKYKEALNAKVHYIKQLYEKLNENTVMIITSDSTSKIKSNSQNSNYLPFFFFNKNSNFSTGDDFSVYPDKKKPIFDPVDLAPTISSLLGIKIPKANQGKFNDEVIKLNNFNDMESKLSYMDLRNQQSRLFSYLVKILNKKNPEEPKEDLEKIGINYIPPDSTTYDFYYSEIKLFSQLAKNNYKKFYRREQMTNKLMALFCCIFSIFLTGILLQYSTFADISNIIYLSFNKNSVLNLVCFFGALIYLILFYVIYYLIIWVFSVPQFGSLGEDTKTLFSSFGVSYLEYIKVCLFPVIVYVIYSKIIYWSLFYSHFREFKDFDKGEVKFAKNFALVNLFRNIKSAVLKEGALAYIYLIRTYTLFFSIIFSMIIFYFVNSHLFLFTSNDLRSLIIYNEETMHYESLKFWVNIQIVNLICIIMQLIFFLNYPKFSKTKQIFDSIFILYDLKIINSLEFEDSTCEKDVLESRFIVNFLNFDYQSEIYHFTTNGFEFPSSILSEKYKAALIIFKILFCKYNLSEIEKIAKLETFVLCKDDRLRNNMRRANMK